MNASVRFTGDLSVDLLRQAFAYILERHAGLRMRLVVADGRFCQRIASCDEYAPLKLIQVASLTEAEARLSTVLRGVADLEHDGPVYAELLQVGLQDHLLVLAIHAIAIDAHALALLLRELLAVYSDLVSGRLPTLAPCLSYEEHLLSHTRSGIELSEPQMQHWRRVLSDSRAPIASDLVPSAERSGATRVAIASLTASEARRVHAFANAVGVSMPSALYSAIFIALLLLYEHEEMSATVTYSGRDSHPLLTLCAKTARLFPLRVTANPDLTLEQFARDVQSAFMRGVMASRPPFTAERARMQLCEAVVRKDNGVNLVIADNPLPERALQLPLSHLRAERVLMGGQPYEGMEADESAPFHRALVLLLMRDPLFESARPVVFSGAFLSSVISERTVRHLLNRVWSIARLISSQNRTLRLRELVSRTRQLYKASAIR
jgi:hypothetical protein